MRNTPVKDLMELQLILVSPDDTLADASLKMKEFNCGFLPVGTPEKIEGVITDRDIIVRAVALGKDPAWTKISECMTDIVCTCTPYDTLAAAAQKMRLNNVSRLIVTDNEDRMCGVITFGRILRNYDDDREITEVVACATGNGAEPGLQPF